MCNAVKDEYLSQKLLFNNCKTNIPRLYELPLLV
jgi:hypothetical protein